METSVLCAKAEESFPRARRSSHPRGWIGHPTAEAIFPPMEYLPTLTLNFPGGMKNAYRIRQKHVEFQAGDGTWRILAEEDLQLHFALHTEVSSWLLKYQTEFNAQNAKG